MTITNNPFTAGQTLWNEHEKYIKSTARKLAYSHPKVEEEDILQEIHLFLWEKESALLAQRRSSAYVATCIRNVATNYALKTRDAVLMETDCFYYGIDEVKALLPFYYDGYESWAQATNLDGFNGDYVEVFSDFSLVMDRLSDKQKAILAKKYRDDEDFSDAADRNALSRAVRKFAGILNAHKNIERREHTGPGSRKVLTNAGAMYATKTNED